MAPPPLPGEKLSRNSSLASASQTSSRLSSSVRIGAISSSFAALGLSQLTKLGEFVSERHKIAKRYDDILSDIDWLVTPWQSPDVYSGLHLYILRVCGKELNYTRDKVFDRLRAAGILVNLHYIPIYRHPYYESMGFERESFPVAEAYYSEAISLPMFPGLTTEQQDEIVNRLMHPAGYQTLF